MIGGLISNNSSGIIKEGTLESSVSPLWLLKEASKTENKVRSGLPNDK